MHRAPRETRRPGLIQRPPETHRVPVETQTAGPDTDGVAVSGPYREANYAPRATETLLETPNGLLPTAVTENSLDFTDLCLHI